MLEIPFTKTILDKIKLNRDKVKLFLSEHVNSIYQETRNSIEKDIAEKEKLYKPINGIKLESSILYGDPSNQIIDYTKNNRVDLIVMESNGLQGLAKIRGLGSVSRKVSEAVSCPMTIIR